MMTTGARAIAVASGAGAEVGGAPGVGVATGVPLGTGLGATLVAG
jgi:hypothetical protein